MLLRQYGVVYKRVGEEHLEMLRQWRNHPDIVKNMLRKEYITEEQQKKWFAEVNNNNNFFFIIHENGHAVGLVHCKNIDYVLKTAETGIFIFDKKFVKTKLFLYASMTVLNFAFYHLKLNCIYVNVLKTNSLFVRTVEKLSFVKEEAASDEIGSRYHIDVKSYEALFEKHAHISMLLSKEKNEKLEIEL